jgi:hypothetical protein
MKLPLKMGDGGGRIEAPNNPTINPTKQTINQTNGLGRRRQINKAAAAATAAAN